MSTVTVNLMTALLTNLDANELHKDGSPFHAPF